MVRRFALRTFSQQESACEVQDRSVSDFPVGALIFPDGIVVLRESESNDNI